MAKKRSLITTSSIMTMDQNLIFRTPTSFCSLNQQFNGSESSNQGIGVCSSFIVYAIDTSTFSAYKEA